MIAAVTGIGAIVAICLLFPPSSNLLFRSNTSVVPAEEPLTSALLIEKTRNADAKLIPPELLDKHRDLNNAIRQVEIEYIGELRCLLKPTQPNELRFCKPATYSANITYNSAESIVRDILTAFGNLPTDYLTASSYSFEFAVEGRGMYSVTISVF